ncbi:SDR family NAD(P)-dependent oxidoreductase [Flavobacterium urocaniciphilum]|uniref:NAD(P)-dependent dehydrogenase, short-chain alcohol dehydrogenase family n=1 Tax=Flavobacterium urocaniciphilum TaxID=1299341 RepID=A0A1H9CA01_9FLAO|nr:SDR family oxidoreductase [Flavobacterium urocaniciphilum]SEP97982.1 NAD(P)-dependent dehydrogenase, short-chain alcohol dehydrogenase family [Flavobacterium urocaniciphilum]
MKNYLIVGGSKGVGEQIVQELSEKGNFCHVISRTNPTYSFNGNWYQLDALNDELPQLESLDGLVYCLGSINLKPFHRLSLDDFKSDYAINVEGAIKAFQYYLPALKKSELASVVMFSTVAVQSGMPFHASIAASKGAIEGLVKSFAAEFAPKIRVNAIAPSLIDTPLASGILRSELIKENIIAKHPLKRILNPTDVSKTACFLLSDDSNGITGQIIVQDNGLVSLSY